MKKTIVQAAHPGAVCHRRKHQHLVKTEGQAADIQRCPAAASHHCISRIIIYPTELFHIMIIACVSPVPKAWGCGNSYVTSLEMPDKQHNGTRAADQCVTTGMIWNQKLVQKHLDHVNCLWVVSLGLSIVSIGTFIIWYTVST